MRQRRSHIFPKDKDGWYCEPSWVSRRLFEVEDFPDPIYDPACGWGTILKAAEAAGYRIVGSDIVDRQRHGLGEDFHKRDFLTWRGRVSGSTVTNPPFDYVQEFGEHALDLGATKVAMIMLVRRLNAAHWLRKLPLERIWLLTPRPSMPPGSHILRVERGEIDERTGKPCKIGGDKQDFCWLVFRGGYVGNPTISWLHRDRASGNSTGEFRDLPYDAVDDFSRSIDEAYTEIRARQAAGGPGWRPQ
jgi:hypothetical protein